MGATGRFFASRAFSLRPRYTVTRISSCSIIRPYRARSHANALSGEKGVSSMRAMTMAVSVMMYGADSGKSGNKQTRDEPAEHAA